LEDRARERYGALDQMSSELRWLREQRDALDALVEALRTGDGWLAYRAEALWDQLLELEAQTVEGASTVEKVRTALVDRDKALERAREDLARARTLAVERETEVASVRAQLQQDHATLEEACAWQRQAEEKDKEVEELRTSVAEKAASLASAEEQLRQERAACQQAEDQLQQERAALEWEPLAREEVQGQLQQERAALEGAQATLKQRDNDVSRLNGELVQLSISHEDLRQSLEEQEATVCDLRREAEEARKALNLERKQVEGELRPALFHSSIWLARDPLPTLVSLSFFRPADRPRKYDHPG
jgi:chromosome segregation ATPase